jgi:hypothetical protein
VTTPSELASARACATTVGAMNARTTAEAAVDLIEFHIVLSP